MWTENTGNGKMCHSVCLPSDEYKCWKGKILKRRILFPTNTNERLTDQEVRVQVGHTAYCQLRNENTGGTQSTVNSEQEHGWNTLPTVNLEMGMSFQIQLRGQLYKFLSFCSNFLFLHKFRSKNSCMESRCVVYLHREPVFCQWKEDSDFFIVQTIAVSSVS